MGDAVQLGVEPDDRPPSLRSVWRLPLNAGTLSRRVVPFSDHPEAAFRAAVRQWLSHLARSEWEAALGMLDEPNSYGVTWTQESTLTLLHDTFSPETQFQRAFGPPCFTEPLTATGTEHGTFGEAADGSFWLDHDVPLNGIFSDLTAQFEFHRRPDGFAMVVAAPPPLIGDSRMSRARKNQSEPREGDTLAEEFVIDACRWHVDREEPAFRQRSLDHFRARYEVLLRFLREEGLLRDPNFESVSDWLNFELRVRHLTHEGLMLVQACHPNWDPSFGQGHTQGHLTQWRRRPSEIRQKRPT